MISRASNEDVTPHLDIAPPRDADELRTFAAILANVLYYPNIEESDWTKIEGVENYRLARLNGQVVGGLAIQRMGQWFGGRSVPMGGVRCVGVSPASRSIGVAHHLLLKSLEELHTEGVALATLYPSTQKVYLRAGFERAGTSFSYRLPTRSLDALGRPLTTRQVEVTDSAFFADIYRRHAMACHGNLDRNAWAWSRILNRHANISAYAFEGDSSTDGYIIYSSERTSNALRGEMFVHDLVALTPASINHLVTFLYDQHPMVEWVKWHGGPAELLFHKLTRQDYEVTKLLHWMLRIVDVQAALTSRGYPLKCNAEVHLDVQDELLPWNNGRFLLEVSGGHPSVQKGGRGSLRIDVRGLAALYTGYLSPTELKALGLINGEEFEIAAAALIFSGSSPWMADWF
jgi:predicted acetyltransferase